MKNIPNTLRRFVMFAVIGVFLVGCSDRPDYDKLPVPKYLSEEHSNYFRMPLATGGHIVGRASKGSNSGPHPGFPASVNLSYKTTPGDSWQPTLAPLDPNLANRFAKTYQAGGSPDVAFALGRQVASQTVCRGQTITENKVGRRLRGNDIGVFLAANGGQVFGGRVPEGLEGIPIPPAERLKFSWRVSLWCR